MLGLIVAVAPIVAFESSAAGVSRQSVGYQRGRVWGGALGGGVALGTAIIAVVNYHRSSSERRIERSMNFWRRANEDPYLRHLDAFLRAWAATEATPNPPATTRFAALGGARQESLSAEHGELRISIEHLLDFYDEACGGVLSGACDGLAMYGYLGSLMVKQTEFLDGFIREWRATQERKEKWDYLSHLTREWSDRSAELEHRVKTVFRDPTKGRDRLLVGTRDVVIGMYLQAVAIRKRDRVRRLLQLRRSMRGSA